jgi:hypothetical protein
LASCAVFKVRKRSNPRGTPVDGLSKLSSARAWEPKLPIVVHDQIRSTFLGPPDASAGGT